MVRLNPVFCPKSDAPILTARCFPNRTVASKCLNRGGLPPWMPACGCALAMNFGGRCYGSLIYLRRSNNSRHLGIEAIAIAYP